MAAARDTDARAQFCDHLVPDQLLDGLHLGHAPGYRDGILMDVTIIVQTVNINFPSPYGSIVGLVLLAGSVGMFLFERWSWAKDAGEVRVEPWTFNMRIVAYLGLSMPGFFCIFQGCR